MCLIGSECDQEADRNPNQAQEKSSKAGEPVALLFLYKTLYERVLYKGQGLDRFCQFFYFNHFRSGCTVTRTQDLYLIRVAL